jgi:uncharacterized protein YqfA (UPF0365 family)
VVDTAFGVVRGQDDIIWAFVTSNNPRAITTPTIVKRVLVGVQLTARTRLTNGLP